MTVDLRGAVRDIASLLEAEAEATEIAGTMPDHVAAAVHATGIYRASTPACLGGLEADISTLLDIYETTAYADGSAGWSIMANLSSTSIAAAFTGDAAVEAMFADPAASHAGMLGPVGIATETADGFHVKGNWQFGSGISNATWVGMGAMVMRGDEIAMTEIGMPYMLIAFAPKSEVTITGGWDVMGLVGTGSYDYTVDTHVPADFAFALLEAKRQRGGPVYELGIMGLTSAGHAGFAIGVGMRALDEVLEIAKSKARMGQDAVASHQMFQHDWAYHDAAVRSARAYVYATFGAAEAEVVSGAPLGFETAARMRQAATYVTRVAADAARFAYTWAGSQGLRNPSVVQRCFRDIHAGTQHIFVDNNTLTGLTQTMLM